jgi:hypothetical protein
MSGFSGLYSPWQRLREVLLQKMQFRPLECGWNLAKVHLFELI